jgi:hypothetical protein
MSFCQNCPDMIGLLGYVGGEERCRGGNDAIKGWDAACLKGHVYPNGAGTDRLLTRESVPRWHCTKILLKDVVFYLL